MNNNNYRFDVFQQVIVKNSYIMRPLVITNILKKEFLFNVIGETVKRQFIFISHFYIKT